MSKNGERLDAGELLELGRFNTPTVYNGWELITKHDPAADGFNLEPAHDYMPHLGAMVGYAVTVVIEPSNPKHPKGNKNAWLEYRDYVASVPGPKIVVVQDLDKPRLIGAFWGEVNSNTHRVLGCAGTITDGAIRDSEEMTAAGFKALARGFCVGHALSFPVRWNSEVEVFGRKVKPGQLIHADRHGFLAVPHGEESSLLEATRYADGVERRTKIAATRQIEGKSVESILAGMAKAGADYKSAIDKKFGRAGEL